MSKNLMTIAETADYLRYAKSYFVEHYKDIGVPYIKLRSGKIPFRKAAIESWLQEQEKNRHNVGQLV